MFFDGKLFWILMGIVFVLVAAGFKAFAQDRGWVITWWKGLLAILWYVVFCSSFYAWGTLIGENEGSAGYKIFLLGLFVSAILGVGLWRLLALKPVARDSKSRLALFLLLYPFSQSDDDIAEKKLSKLSPPPVRICEEHAAAEMKGKSAWPRQTWDSPCFEYEISKRAFRCSRRRCIWRRSSKTSKLECSA